MNLGLKGDRAYKKISLNQMGGVFERYEKLGCQLNIEKEYVLALSGSFRFRILTAVILTLFLILTAYGFTKANVIQDGDPADELGDISGYTIANIDYTLSSSDSTKVKNITLSVDPSDGIDESVEARITVDNGATWITCTFLAADKWVCNFPTLREPSIASISNVRLITKTPLPWHKKLCNSILKIFN